MNPAEGRDGNEPPDELARVLREVLSELGVDADPARIANHVRRLDRGLPAEDEFAAICAWLGQCRLLHRLDQRQIPLASTSRFQVPDLMAAFQSGGPVLIEVKAKKTKKLSLRPDYLERLQNYADLLQLPLLIAWKFHAMWALFDIRRLTKAVTNFNIEFGEAMQHTLLGVLAGDFAYTLGSNAGLHFVFSKEELLGTVERNGSKEESWRFRVADAYLSDGEGNRRDDLHPETQQLLAVSSLDERQEHFDDRVDFSFVAEGSQFAHMVLPRLIELEAGLPSGDPWRAILKRAEPIRSIGDFSEAASRALAEGIVHHILHIQPQELPDFLVKRGSASA